MDKNEFEVIVIGGGPAGLTAAIYTCRAGRRTVVIDKLTAGGQLLLTAGLENFPGFPEGVGGAELALRMQEQAERFGAHFVSAEVKSVEVQQPWKIIKTMGGKEFRAKVLLVATGSLSQKLNVPGEEKYFGRGVSVCAVCDAYFYLNEDVVVAGGGDTAVEESLFLTKHVKNVRIIHRRDKLRAQKIFQERALTNPKISFEWNSVIESINGDEQVTGVTVRNLKTDEKKEIACKGVFIFIGWTPNTHCIRELVEVDEKGYIKVNHKMETSVPGIYAAGDVRTQSSRQAIASAGDGACAAISIEEYLTELEGH